MTMSFVFWFLMLCSLIFNGWGTWPAPGAPRSAWAPFGGSFLLFIVLCILGWAQFGNPIK
jgi:hypothetical protein